MLIKYVPFVCRRTFLIIDSMFRLVALQFHMAMSILHSLNEEKKKRQKRTKKHAMNVDKNRFFSSRVHSLNKIIHWPNLPKWTRRRQVKNKSFQLRPQSSKSRYTQQNITYNINLPGRKSVRVFKHAVSVCVNRNKRIWWIARCNFRVVCVSFDVISKSKNDYH